ncbi:MAG: hypothetical protein R3F59_36665 [Myxococcota bacterium]
MNEVLAYVPIDRRLALATRRRSQRSRRTALFADISGFTGLTDLLAARLGARRAGEASRSCWRGSTGR